MTKKRTVRMLYGREGMELSVPDSAVILEPSHAPVLPDPIDAIRRALRAPVGSAALPALLAERKPRSVAITISDITRPVPNALILAALLEQLNGAGVADAQVTIIVGTGMHRPSTSEELRELVGPEVLSRCRIVDHRADDAGSLVRLCDDPPVSLNALFAQADFRIVTGLIEPHFMAGFSGGRKGVCPALVDLATVQRFHGYATLSDARSANGVIEGNPCHAESLRIARLVGVDFLVNVAINKSRQVCGVYAGDMERAHEIGVADVARWTSACVEADFDLIVTCGGGYPLDQTFYQTVKGIVGALPACHDRSVVLIASHCGQGIGSASYSQIMQTWAHDWRGFLHHNAGAGVAQKDQWNAQLQCRVLERIGQQRLWLASDGLPIDIQAKLWVTPVTGEGSAQARCQRAMDDFIRECPEARVAVAPDGPYTMLRRI